MVLDVSSLFKTQKPQHSCIEHSNRWLDFTQIFLSAASFYKVVLDEPKIDQGVWLGITFRLRKASFLHVNVYSAKKHPCKKKTTHYCL